jgi:shikimate kinase
VPERPSTFAGRVWLTGLMGSGKSTVGHLVAESLRARYLDNDNAVALLAGRSTVELSEAGGDLLHEWESRYVHRVVELAPPVVAGIPASIADRPDDLALLHASGLLVYLQADLDTLVARVQADPPRPWLNDAPAEVLARMLAARDQPLSSSAMLVVDATRPSDEVAAEIVEAARSAPPRNESSPPDPAT